MYYTNGKFYNDNGIEIKDSELNRDNVNHPNHYKSKNGLEAIDIMEEYCMDLPGDQAISNSNAIKYILRWHNKNGLEDLKKAQWYLNRLIDLVERDNKNKEEI